MRSPLAAALLLFLLPAPVLAITPRLSRLELRAATGETELRVGQRAGWFGAMATLAVSWDDPPPRTAAMGIAAAPTRADHVRAATSLPAELVRRTLQAAYRAAGLAANEVTIRSALTRARVAALLPEVSLRGAQYAGLDTILYEPNSNASSRDQFRDTRTLEAKLAWRLDRLIYSGDEPQLERLRSERLELKLRITTRVVEALSVRHRALYDLGRLDPASTDAEEAGLKLAEAEATLEALTGGHFRGGAVCRPSREDAE